MICDRMAAAEGIAGIAWDLGQWLRGSSVALGTSTSARGALASDVLAIRAQGTIDPGGGLNDCHVPRDGTSIRRAAGPTALIENPQDGLKDSEVSRCQRPCDLEAAGVVRG
jgi:hypothetical protein